MSDYPMLISNKLHSFRNFIEQVYKKCWSCRISNVDIVFFLFLIFSFISVCIAFSSAEVALKYIVFFVFRFFFFS